MPRSTPVSGRLAGDSAFLEVVDGVVDAEPVDGAMPLEVASLRDGVGQDRGGVTAVVESGLQVSLGAQGALQRARGSAEGCAGAAPQPARGGVDVVAPSPWCRYRRNEGHSG